MADNPEKMIQEMLDSVDGLSIVAKRFGEAVEGGEVSSASSYGPCGCFKRSVEVTEDTVMRVRVKDGPDKFITPADLQIAIERGREKILS